MLTLQITEFIEPSTILQLESIVIDIVFLKMHYKRDIYPYYNNNNNNNNLFSFSYTVQLLIFEELQIIFK